MLIAAFEPVVRVLHFHKFKLLLPVRTLFLQRRGVVAELEQALLLAGCYGRRLPAPCMTAPRQTNTIPAYNTA